MNYILKGKEVVPCDDLMEWAKWYESANRHVAQDTIGNSVISTVFLGIDHSFENGPPLLFETLVFNGKLDGEMNRYSTWTDAVKGHKNMIERVKHEN